MAVSISGDGAVTGVGSLSGLTVTAGSGDLVVGQAITDIVALTQAEYDALTPDATTLYVITG